MYVLLFSASYVEIKRIVKEDVNCFCTKLFKTCCLCSKLLLGLHFRDVVLLSTNEFKIKTSREIHVRLPSITSYKENNHIVHV
ncbi:unnamed protein product [Brassica oleracea]|uniref:Uncharacterized protein n=1 Tax=Brassica oleracea var. oleracea TaxID=109376 RepID=A0A0D2ZT89_BRAOL